MKLHVNRYVFDTLVSHPSLGSVWLSNVRLFDRTVVGDAWDKTGVGSPYYPDDWHGEPITMNFPLSCVRKIVKHDLSPDSDNHQRSP